MPFSDAAWSIGCVLLYLYVVLSFPQVEQGLRFLIEYWGLKALNKGSVGDERQLFGGQGIVESAISSTMLYYPDRGFIVYGNRGFLTYSNASRTKTTLVILKAV
jgi:hypothetical protein